ncbi:GntR family transcriptional regulator [Elioraea sp.]|uniref:GntR family transcriptional regulator n=1 Tax=Elioraea sp. TaxID=2185103 RepID=UPI0025BF1FB4|nr:GntR family transcriptional regulator [Elioraea sp.]
MSLIRPQATEPRDDDSAQHGESPGLPFGSTVYQRVHEHLRAEIVAGRIPPGTRLKIQDLASRLGLSHMPVREALQQLQGEGLVVLQPNRGATVRRMDQHFVRNIFAIREALEGHLTRQAAGLIGAEGIARLREVQSQMRRAQAGGDIGGVVRLNRGFHRTIETATGNDEAIRVLDLHSDLIGALRIRYGYRRGRLATVLRDHDALIAALARGDAAEAGALHDRHIQAARDDMLAAMDDDTTR